MLRPTLVVLMLTTPGLARADMVSMRHPKHAAVETPSDRAYSAAMDKMMATMHLKPTGNPDKDFVTMMLPHHQGAVDMAQVMLKYGKDPELLAMAKAIVDSQTKEIGEMQAWQKAHGR